MLGRLLCIPQILRKNSAIIPLEVPLSTLLRCALEDTPYPNRSARMSESCVRANANTFKTIQRSGTYLYALSARTLYFSYLRLNNPAVSLNGHPNMREQVYAEACLQMSAPLEDQCIHDSNCSCVKVGTRDKSIPHCIHRLIALSRHLLLASSTPRRFLPTLAQPSPIIDLALYLAQPALGGYRRYDPAHGLGNLFRWLLQQCQQWCRLEFRRFPNGQCLRERRRIGIGNGKRCHHSQLPGTNCLRHAIQFDGQHPMEWSLNHHPGRHLLG